MPLRSALVAMVALGLSACLASQSEGTSSSTSGSGTPSGSSGAGASSGASANGSGGSATTGGSSAGVSSGSGGGSTGSTGSTGAATSGGSSGGCTQGQACTPANPCDFGTLDCASGSAVCKDQGTANAAQTGVACPGGGACEGGQCLKANWPAMPNGGGGVIAAPNLILMTYSDDPNAASLDQDAEWVADGGYLPLVAGQYGVGNATVQIVNLGSSSTAPTGTNSNPNAFPTYLQSLFDAQAIPAYAQNDIYILYLPSTWADAAVFCQSYGGYHTYFQDDDGNYPIYAIVPNCLGTQQGALQTLEFSVTHEIVEAATDPYDQSWVFAPGMPWSYIGGELADMCESYDAYYTSPGGSYVAPYIWSNSAIAAGQVPCQPWPAGTPFVSLLSPATPAIALPGSSAQVVVTGWASAPYAAWGLQAIDNPIASADFSTSPQLSSSSISAGGHVTVTLEVPSTALGGQNGAVWVTCFDQSSDQSLGATMIGVTAGCATSAGCGDPTTVCSSDGGTVGSCDTDYCAGNAAPFSTCSSEGSNDGVCLPVPNAQSTAPIEVCSQAGSLASGAVNCLNSRSGTGGVASYCSNSTFCYGFNTPTCLDLCAYDGGAGSCATGNDCVGLDQYFGVCSQDCTSGQACPQGQTCYQVGPGQSACIP